MSDETRLRMIKEMEDFIDQERDMDCDGVLYLLSGVVPFDDCYFDLSQIEERIKHLETEIVRLKNTKNKYLELQNRWNEYRKY